MSKIITLKDGNTIIYPRTISRQIVGDRKEMGDVQGFIDSLVPAVESPYKYYTVRIDLNNPDPETSCEYMDDAVGMTPGYNGWKDVPIIKSIKSCVLGTNGAVKYYLQKDDYTKKEDGSASILDGTDGDVMVEIPKMGYRLWNDENYQYVSVTEDPNKEGYCYYAHSLEADGDCDKIYIGAYLGYVTGNNLYSRSEVSPTTSTTLSNFRTYSANRGIGYSIVSFFPWTLLQCLYVVIYKNLNSQGALGAGYTGTNKKANTGATNNNTFCYGTSSSTTHVKFLGIEDFWGNFQGWLDGIYCDSNYNIKTDYRNSVFTGTNGNNFQFSTATGASSNYQGYINKIMGTNTTGFVKDYNNNTNGSESTYFSDVGQIYPFCFGYCGGLSANAGAFYLGLYYYGSDSSSNLGARLMYKHLKDA